jgi:hypothetical protein
MRWNGEKRREKRRGCCWPSVISYCSIQESGEDGRDGSIPHCRRFGLIGKCFPLHGAAEVGKEMKKGDGMPSWVISSWTLELSFGGG